MKIHRYIERFYKIYDIVNYPSPKDNGFYAYFYIKRLKSQNTASEGVLYFTLTICPHSNVKHQYGQNTHAHRHYKVNVKTVHNQTPAFLRITILSYILFPSI